MHMKTYHVKMKTVVTNLSRKHTHNVQTCETHSCDIVWSPCPCLKLRKHRQAAFINVISTSGLMFRYKIVSKRQSQHWCITALSAHMSVGNFCCCCLCSCWFDMALGSVLPPPCSVRLEELLCVSHAIITSKPKFSGYLWKRKFYRFMSSCLSCAAFTLVVPADITTTENVCWTWWDVGGGGVHW